MTETQIREALDLHDYIGENKAGHVGCSGCTWMSTIPASQLTRVQRVASHRAHQAAVLAALTPADSGLVKALSDLAAEAITQVASSPHGHWREGGPSGRCRTCVAATERARDLRSRLSALLSDAHPGDDEVRIALGFRKRYLLVGHPAYPDPLWLRPATEEKAVRTYEQYCAYSFEEYVQAIGHVPYGLTAERFNPRILITWEFVGEREVFVPRAARAAGETGEVER